MEQPRGEKNKPYVRVFEDVLDHQLYPITWLRKHGGERGVDWDEYFEGKEYVLMGMNNDVGCNGDLTITIYNPEVAFRFEIFKGWRATYFG